MTIGLTKYKVEIPFVGVFDSYEPILVIKGRYIYLQDFDLFHERLSLIVITDGKKVTHVDMVSAEDYIKIMDYVKR